MTILMFEGFECMNAVDQGLHVFDDYLNDWNGANPFIGLSVANYTGHNGGYAMGSGYSNICKATSSTGKMRLGFWGYDIVNDDVDKTLSWVTFQNGSKNYGTWCNQDGDMFLGMSASDSRSTTVSARSTDWHHWEFYVDVTTGSMSVKKDGTTIVSSTTMDIGSAPDNIQIRIGNLGILQGDTFPWYSVFDDFYVTDGPELVSGINGVCVIGLLDAYTISSSSNSGFRFGLIINGDRYQSTPATAEFSSQGIGSGGLNTLRQVSRYWFTDPSDGNQWTTSKLSALEGWGYCWLSDETDTGWYRIASGALTYLDNSGTYPEVKTIKPSTMTYFSGDHWGKSDDTKTYSSLLPLPRDNTQLTSSNPKAVFCNGPGCMFFNPQITTEGTVETLGLTFAEEYREDYHDWVKLDGTGQNYTSFFSSGYGIYSQGDKRFSSTYVTINYENSGPASSGDAYVQGVWDYATSNETGRYSMRQKIYQNAVDNYEHRARKLKIRGRGRALQLYISSVEGKQFGINGWSMFITGNANV